MTVSPLLQALYEGRNEDAKALGAGAELDLFEASAFGDVERLARLLEAGEDANQLAPDGYTPLQLAAFFGHVEAARLLVDRGADLTAVSKNEQETYPLQAAVAGNHTEVARLLLEAGAPPTERTIESARRHGNEELERLLLARR